MNAAPASPLVRCPACYFMQPGPWVEGGETLRECERCHQFLRISVFPTTLAAPPIPTQTGARAMEGDATCFFHPTKRAERPCDRCGRFLCALCDLPVGTRHLCPGCLKAGVGENEPLPELVTERVVWGRMALQLALLNFFCFLPAPICVFVALYGWNKPGSLVHGKRRGALFVALLLGLGQASWLVFLFYGGWKGATHHVH